MMLFTLFLSFMITGSLTCDDSDSHCGERALGRELSEVKYVPNKEELKTFCPKVMTFLECERDVLECHGQSLDELSTSSDKRKATIAKITLETTGLVRDICDEDSSLHTDYVASASCFKEYLDEATTNCHFRTRKVVLDLINNLYPNEDDLPDNINDQYFCMMGTYYYSCVIDSIGDSCGSVARRVALAIVERRKAGLRSCNSLENAADVKSRFLDSLDLDAQRRASAQEVFDLFERRR